MGILGKKRMMSRMTRMTYLSKTDEIYKNWMLLIEPISVIASWEDYEYQGHVTLRHINCNGDDR
jgi:hypothetical protein